MKAKYVSWGRDGPVYDCGRHQKKMIRELTQWEKNVLKKDCFYCLGGE